MLVLLINLNFHLKPLGKIWLIFKKKVYKEEWILLNIRNSLEKNMLRKMANTFSSHKQLCGIKLESKVWNPWKNLKESWWSVVFFWGRYYADAIYCCISLSYLNWFSKTEVIRWHKVPKIRFIENCSLANYVVIRLWLRHRIELLFFLSFTHVY